MLPDCILIVEDDPVAAELCRAALHGCADLMLAPTVQQAFELLSADPPTLLLLDYLLPDGTALDLLDRIEAAGLEIPPFVVATGAGDERLVVAMQRRGARDYLIKDATFVQLLPVVVGRVLAMLATEEQLREAENALRQSEERYRLLFENMTTAFALHEIICDPAGKPFDYRFLEVNPTFERITGLAAGAVVGRTVREVLPEIESSWVERYGSVALGGEPLFFENYSHELGRHFKSWCFSPQPGRFAVIFSDVSERVLAGQRKEAVETELRESQRRLLQAQEMGKIASFEWDLATGRIDWTPQGYQLLERPPGTFDQSIEQWFEFIALEDRPQLQRDIEAVLACGGVAQSEYRLVMPDGRHKHILSIGEVVFAADGRPKSIVGVSQDVSDRKHVEFNLAEAAQRAEAANRAKSDFLANMSHELRTPLNGILGMMQLLETTTLDAEQQEYVEIAASSGWSLLRLINDILDLSRVEAGKLDIRSDPFDMREIVGFSLQFFRQAAGEKGLQLQGRVAPGIPLVLYGDVTRLRQILFNVIGNAIKFTPEGTVEVAVEALAPPAPGRQRLALTVKDSGIGMTPAMLARVCEPFAQEENSYLRNFQGAGLGLSIVKRLAELMAGTVRIDSQQGKGTLVTVELELVSEPPHQVEAAIVSELPRAVRGDGDRLRVLVAEDNLVNQKTVMAMLQRAGHDVVIAGNGVEALQRLTETHIDVILMDVQMPELSGLEATLRIRRDTSGTFDPTVPIIGLTAFAMDGDSEHFIAAGMDGCLPKPLVMAELAALLGRFAGGKSVAQSLDATPMSSPVSRRLN